LFDVGHVVKISKAVSFVDKSLLASLCQGRKLGPINLFTAPFTKGEGFVFFLISKSLYHNMIHIGQFLFSLDYNLFSYRFNISYMCGLGVFLGDSIGFVSLCIFADIVSEEPEYQILCRNPLPVLSV